MYITIRIFDCQIGKAAEQLFIESEMGDFIMNNLPLEKTNEATMIYIMDFVQMSHKALCSKEEMVGEHLTVLKININN